MCIFFYNDHSITIFFSGKLGGIFFSCAEKKIEDIYLKKYQFLSTMVNNTQERSNIFKDLIFHSVGCFELVNTILWPGLLTSSIINKGKSIRMGEF